jgi:EAL domain-containing protein (putative c-di-GMP-specific phosphodiesterase class I)/FixJ family two-component response regulator
VASTAEGRLLILEDDASVGKMIRMIAVAAGFEVRLAANSDAFFAEFDLWQPTHIALDLVMPDMDGVQVLEALGRRHCAADIIITSGMGSRVLDAAKRSANEHGLHVVGLLAKPFPAAALRALLIAKLPAETPILKHAETAGSSVDRATVTDASLRAAIGNGHIAVEYQPKVTCFDGRLAGFEALARWKHPQIGLIMPDHFVPFAEVHGLIDALTDEVLEQSLSWFGAQSFDDARNPRISLSINLSAASLQDGAFLDRIIGCCRRSGVLPDRVIFEVTETSAMQNPIAALDMLTRMRMQGFELSIDDFGTGYSSMLQLVRLPFSEIKIDKSFTMSAISSPESRAVVKSIVDLGRSLGLKSAAEGVEDAPTLALLRDIGCDFAQGYFIGIPMGGEALAGWIAGRRA